MRWIIFITIFLIFTSTSYSNDERKKSNINLDDSMLPAEDHLIGEKIINNKEASESSKKKQELYIPPPESDTKDIVLMEEKNSNKESQTSEQFYLKYYTTLGKKQLNLKVIQVNHLLPAIKHLFIERRVPLKMVLLTFLTHTKPKVSITSGKGFWQTGTNFASEYNLRINWWLDERLNVVKESKTVLDYLVELKRSFGDWDFAIAAYHSGKEYIANLRMKYPGKSFKEIAKYSDIDKNCSDFVLQFYTLLEIYANPQKYDVLPLIFAKRNRNLISLSVLGPLSLEQLEIESGVIKGTIISLNPQFIKSFIPKNQLVLIKVPIQLANKIFLTYTRLAHNTNPKSIRQIPSYQEKSVVYNKKDNILNNRNQINDQKYYGSEKEYYSSEEEYKYQNSPVQYTNTTNNENLNASQSTEKTYQYSNYGNNEENMESESIVNQEKDYGYTDRNPSNSKIKSKLKIRQKKPYRLYRIKKGDTLIKIANQYGVRLKDIFAINKGLVIRNLRIGRYLKIPTR